MLFSPQPSLTIVAPRKHLRMRRTPSRPQDSYAVILGYFVLCVSPDLWWEPMARVPQQLWKVSHRCHLLIHSHSSLSQARKKCVLYTLLTTPQRPCLQDCRLKECYGSFMNQNHLFQTMHQIYKTGDPLN